MAYGLAVNVSSQWCTMCSSLVSAFIGAVPAVSVCIICDIASKDSKTVTLTQFGTGRAIEAPVIRQLFSSSPRDPRYHMLSYISHKFSQEPRNHSNEPRAALFLNRFSRTLAIMYATNGLADVLGVSADRLIGKSFYFCIQENCLREAVKCLESAKANDSIAYLRFWFRDPTQDAEPDRDDRMSEGNSSADDDDDGGVHLSELMDQENDGQYLHTNSSNSLRSSAEPRSNHSRSLDSDSRSPSGNSTDMDGNVNDVVFDQPAGGQSATSSISTPDESSTNSQRQNWASDFSPIELEAVVSCTSDGLVVVLRAARPFMPHVSQAMTESPKKTYTNGFFASPWAMNPIIPDMQKRSGPLPNHSQPARFPLHPTAAQANTAATQGPVTEDFMNSIREVAVFAWSLIGINGSLVKHSRGSPSGESQPPDGLPVWDPYSNAGLDSSSRQEVVPSRYQYSFDDGTPIYDQMQVDPSPTGLRSNGIHHSDTPAIREQGGEYALSRQEPLQSSTPYRQEVGSALKNSISVNDLGRNLPTNGNIQTHAYEGIAQTTNGTYGVTNPIAAHGSEYPSYSSGHYPSNGTTAAGHSSQHNDLGRYQNNDHHMEYDPYASENYPLRPSINGDSDHVQHQHEQTPVVNKSWTTNASNHEQTVNGFSRWS